MHMLGAEMQSRQYQAHTNGSIDLAPERRMTRLAFMRELPPLHPRQSLCDVPREPPEDQNAR